MKRFIFSFSVFLVISFCSVGYAQTVTMDNTEQYQLIDGFGGFGPMKVWWSSPPFYNSDYIDAIVDDLGANIIRTQLYWDFEESNDNADPNSIDWGGFNYSSSSDNGKQFDFISALDARGGIKQIASVWTPPTWMVDKSDPNSIPDECYNGTWDPCGGKLSTNHYDEFAEYIVAYLQRVKTETGVDMYAISLQNEPRFANPFESCVYEPDELAELIEIVGDRLEDENLDTKIFGAEDMAYYYSSWINAILANNETSRKHLDIFAVHGYADGVNLDLGSPGNWESLSNSVRNYGKDLWMTETSGQAAGWEGAWDMGRGLQLALKYGKLNAWVYWYLSGNLLQESNPSNKYKLFYAFKNFYRYIRPGAYMVKCDANDEDIVATAFHHGDESRLTVVLINNSASQKTVDMDMNNIPSSFQAYRTSSSEDCENVGSMNSNAVTLSAESITTLVYTGSNNSPAINTINDTIVLAGDGEQVINLTGINDGNGGAQSLSASVSNKHTDIISNVSIDYTSGSNTGTLSYTPATGAFGVDTITVLLEDDGGQTANMHQKRISFIVRVLPFVNQAPNVDTPDDIIIDYEYGQEKEIELSGIDDGNDGSQDIQFTLKSSNAGVIKYPQVEGYTGGSTAKLTYFIYGKGTSTITLTVKDNGGTWLDGNDTKTITFDITVEESSGDDIFNASEDESIKVYPNPATDILNVEMPLQGECNVKITNTVGEVLTQYAAVSVNNMIQVPVNDLLPGLYCLIIDAGDNSYKATFIVK